MRKGNRARSRKAIWILSVLFANHLVLEEDQQRGVSVRRWNS